MKKKSIFLISGSSGGHAVPVFSLAKKLKDNNFQIKVFVSGSKIEQEVFKQMPTVKILSGRLDRQNTLRSIGGSILIALGFIGSFFYLLFNRPNLIFSKGGFLSVPILYAAKVLGIPYFAHDSDSEIGLANKMFYKKAKKFFVSFPPKVFNQKFPNNTVYSGQIVREEFSAERQKLNIKSTIFITGGGQGAHKINQIIFENLPNLLKKYKIIHQIGQNDFKEADLISQALGLDAKANYQYFDFSIEKSKSALANADLVISRAGMNTIGELAALGKASILIPYPYAASDHQTKNARYLEKLNAAIMIKEDNLNGKSLLDRINYLLSNRKNLEILGKNISKEIKHDGLDIVFNEIEKFIKE